MTDHLSAEEASEIQELVESESWDLAIERCRLLLEGRSECPDLWHFLGISLRGAGQNNEGLKALESALTLNAEDGLLLYNYGTFLAQEGRVGEALATYEKAIGFEPNYPALRCNYGALLTEVGKTNQAIEQLDLAIRLKADYPEAYNNVGNALRDQGRIDEALTMYREAVKLGDNYFTAHSNLLLCSCYQSKFAPERVWAEHKLWGAHYGNLPTVELVPRPKRDRIRVGYVSADFKVHSVAFFVQPIFENHNVDEFEVYCYSDVDRADAITQRIQATVEHFKSIRHLDHEKAAEMIAADELDILVDLGGHTSFNRLRMFARKPAPIQMTYIGYPNTTGLSQMDYRLVDEYTDPPSTSGYCIETLLRLKPGFIAYRPEANVPEVAPLPSLTQEQFTFGSFNIIPKINIDVIQAWASILEKAPNSRLLLKAKQLQDPFTQKRYLEAFEHFGIESDRLILRSFATSFQDHLAMYNELDLALDPFPYNGTTTTCEALWMGVPTLTLAGKSHAGRVGVSLNSRVGLEQFITEDLESYIETAVLWSSKPKELGALRMKLREQAAQSTLCDAEGLTEALEEQFRKVLVGV